MIMSTLSLRPISRRLAILATASALAAGSAGGAQAASLPVVRGAAIAGEAPIVEVRGGRKGAAIAAGIALGLLGAAAAAAAADDDDEHDRLYGRVRVHRYGEPRVIDEDDGEPSPVYRRRAYRDNRQPAPYGYEADREEGHFREW
ncbi:hypothetical protein QNA08_02890 [Chelatococcus sp. SYSU_G07232]|uniref:Transmembrane protein n=1 Tax=Chelatococcus albus TaxID=3047466 RepID=A0ABT7ACT1_9HYPH|nr:hypothetical protein [Chelatococcus sp. SYSU_G07232]MDJ1157185.1 hypothetical protein [Chelatococcus sp. SYSU_G07232]